VNQEPVAITGALSVLFGAVITLLNVFKITHWTTDEMTAVATVWSAFMALILVVPVRNKVTPITKTTQGP
jgi:hypothetical protein